MSNSKSYYTSRALRTIMIFIRRTFLKQKTFKVRVPCCSNSTIDIDIDTVVVVYRACIDCAALDFIY